ncbi:hypothetical protein B0H14DRAFT_2792534 [Mycena olivaceomarginata]|nr:hypothetical protein B0H14DRAFT_2792534 [Mycena olivaceomarginata]
MADSNSDSDNEAAPAVEVTAYLQRAIDTYNDVYENVQKEFYAWKGAYAVEILAGLADPDSPELSSAKQFRMPRACFQPVPHASNPDVMYVEDYDDGMIVMSEALPSIVFNLEYPDFPPHPPYQYCTPASRNENTDLLNNKRAPFVPFPEDTAFRYKYLRCFKKRDQWRADQCDPDEEVMQYEVDIDVMLRACGQTPLRPSNETGLLWNVSQRDLPQIVWGDRLSSSSKPQLPPHFAQNFPEPDDIFEQINRGMEKFCPNLNCITHNCHVHVDYQWDVLRTPPIEPKEPRCTSNKLREMTELSCGNECFLDTSEEDMEDADDVPLSDQRVLHGLLKIEPDMLPCHLAVICRMTCRIAFALRKQNIDDEDLVLEVSSRRRSKKKARLNFCTFLLPIKIDALITYFSRRASPTHLNCRTTPCAHTGPCSSAACGCFKSKRYCERNCRCEGNCARRWPGCNSSCRQNLNCSNRTRRKCKCRLAGRECDPEKCTMCHARDTHTRCKNVRLQLGRCKRFEVKSSTYGLGAFASEKIRADDCIGEYVGELVDDVVEHRDIIRRYSGLNYCFGMLGTTIDSHWFGNPTRFLNDSKPKPPNCAALETLVNGDRRIVIFALEDIRKGTELTLDYGPGYWGKEDQAMGVENNIDAESRREE